MFTKGNKVYADAYKYLKHKTKNILVLSIKGSAEDFDEVDMVLPLKLEVVGDKTFVGSEHFFRVPENVEYAVAKEKIIKSRYTYDEQIAIMLNKDKSEDDNMLYEKMQEWRDFATEVAKIATEKA